MEKILEMKTALSLVLMELLTDLSTYVSYPIDVSQTDNPPTYSNIQVYC